MSHSPFHVKTFNFTDADQPDSGDYISAAACTDGTIEFMMVDSYQSEGRPTYVSLSHSDAKAFANQVKALTKF